MEREVLNSPVISKEHVRNSNHSERSSELSRVSSQVHLRLLLDQSSFHLLDLPVLPVLLVLLLPFRVQVAEVVQIVDAEGSALPLVGTSC